MHSRKHPASFKSGMLLAIAGHTMMGTALGLALSFALIAYDGFGLSGLIAHSVNPQASILLLAGTLTLAFAVGATLTGFVFTVMERDKHD